LAHLKRAGLVADRKDGLCVHYRLAEPLANHARQLIGSLCKLKLNAVNCTKWRQPLECGGLGPLW